MTNIDDICNSLNTLVKLIGEAAWELDGKCGLLEEARNLHRYVRRVEALVNDVKPYLRGVRVWGSLREIEGVLSSLLYVLQETAKKGPLVRYLQADRVLARFAAATVHLDTALGHLQDEVCREDDTQSSGIWPGGGSCNGPTACVAPGAVPDETRAELQVVRELLQSAAFKLPAEHLDSLEGFRKACDGVQAHFHDMMLSYGHMMKRTQQDRFLSKESFCAVIEELQTEVELLLHLMLPTVQLPGGRSSRGDERGTAGTWNLGTGHVNLLYGHAQPDLDQARSGAAEQHYLRMLMDVVRACHVDTDCEAPLDFLCPLTHQLMQDPVLLHETGHSYERKALEEWWATGHRFCPRTGLHLKRLNISPNHSLHGAIARWRLHSDLHLSFKPVLNTLVSQQHQRQLQQHRKPTPYSQREARQQLLAPTPGRAQDCALCVQAIQQEAATRKDCQDYIPANFDGAKPHSCATPSQRLQQRQLSSTVSLEGALAAMDIANANDGSAVLDDSKGGTRNVSRTESGTTSECTGDCSPRMYASQHSSSQELELSRFASGAGECGDV